MQLVQISVEDYNKIWETLKSIEAKIDSKSNQFSIKDQWLDIQDACLILRVSKRTLQSYRDNRILPFSQISGKIYFKISDIQDLLEKHYTNKSK